MFDNVRTSSEIKTNKKRIMFFSLFLIFSTSKITYMIISNSSVNSDVFQRLSYWSKYCQSINIYCNDAENISEETKENFQLSNINFYLTDVSKDYDKDKLTALVSMYENNLDSDWYFIGTEKSFVYPGKAEQHFRIMNKSEAFVYGSFWYPEPSMLDGGLFFSKKYAIPFFQQLKQEAINPIGNYYSIITSVHNKLISTPNNQITYDRGYFITCLYYYVNNNPEGLGSCISLGSPFEEDLDLLKLSLSTEVKVDNLTLGYQWSQYPSHIRMMLGSRGDYGFFLFGQKLIYHDDVIRAVSPIKKISENVYDQEAEHKFKFRYIVKRRVFAGEFYSVDETLPDDKIFRFYIGDVQGTIFNDRKISYIHV